MLLGLAALPACRPAGPVVSTASLFGWESLALRNAVAEVMVVPAIGRVMQFRLLDDASGGPFWRHEAIGPGLAGDENGWINFGGDKAWPAPQSAWESMVGKGWPPPRTFDAVAHAATIEGGAVMMLSPVDPAYGIRVRRKISLHASEPVMSIETTFEKVQGPPVRVAVWTITQLLPPARMEAVLPARSAFAGGHRRVMPAEPLNLAVAGGRLSLERDPHNKTMIATDADRLEWVGAEPNRVDLVVESKSAAAVAGEAAVWPDGAHSQIYTNPDGPEAYVELELLGPLHDLAPGQSASLATRYELLRRDLPGRVQPVRR
ncbi:MAG TPA: hypothetical protein VIQ54_07135 [Polyangia bacterium]